MCYISATKWRREASAIPSKHARHQESDASCTDGCVFFLLIYVSFFFKPTFLIFQKVKVGLSDHHVVCSPTNS
jgi:hypothetical protein